MLIWEYLIAAIFLPLFPLSMIFNRLFASCVDARVRMLMLLLWPLAGMLILTALGQQSPAWMIYWAVLTSAFYAFRTIALRDLAAWIAHMATSAWALLWILTLSSSDTALLLLQTIAVTMPFVLLALLMGKLDSVFGAAFAGVYGGLAQTMPRLSLLLVISILAAVGTPLFPGFFTLLAMIAESLKLFPLVAILVLLVWMMWAWSGTLMTRGLVVGPAEGKPHFDVSQATSILVIMVLVVLAVAGMVSMSYLL